MGDSPLYSSSLLPRDLTSDKVRCPTCSQPPGEDCVVRSADGEDSKKAKEPHRSREKRAEAAHVNPYPVMGAELKFWRKYLEEQTR